MKLCKSSLHQSQSQTQTQIRTPKKKKMVVSGFICGTSGLPRDEDDQLERQTRSANSSPRKSRSKRDKNPYSTRGLDRFSALLTQIEEKRQRIYSQVDPQQISLVRFIVTDDHEFKPIVVKAKSSKPNISEHQPEKQPEPNSDMTEIHKSSTVRAIKENPNEKKMKKIKSSSWKEPKRYLAMIVIAILVCLLAVNKSFAIMCTSIGWYIIPTILNASNSSTSNSNNKNVANKHMSTQGTKSFKHPRERLHGPP